MLDYRSLVSSRFSIARLPRGGADGYETKAPTKVAIKAISRSPSRDRFMAIALEDGDKVTLWNTRGFARWPYLQHLRHLQLID